jgi:hypothetical protein
VSFNDSRASELYAFEKKTKCERPECPTCTDPSYGGRLCGRLRHTHFNIDYIKSKPRENKKTVLIRCDPAIGTHDTNMFGAIQKRLNDPHVGTDTVDTDTTMNSVIDDLEQVPGSLRWQTLCQHFGVGITPPLGFQPNDGYLVYTGFKKRLRIENQRLAQMYHMAIADLTSLHIDIEDCECTDVGFLAHFGVNADSLTEHLAKYEECYRNLPQFVGYDEYRVYLGRVRAGLVDARVLYAISRCSRVNIRLGSDTSASATTVFRSNQTDTYVDVTLSRGRIVANTTNIDTPKDCRKHTPKTPPYVLWVSINYETSLCVHCGYGCTTHDQHNCIDRHPFGLGNFLKRVDIDKPAGLINSGIWPTRANAYFEQRRVFKRACEDLGGRIQRSTPDTEHKRQIKSFVLKQLDVVNDECDHQPQPGYVTYTAKLAPPTTSKFSFGRKRKHTKDNKVHVDALDAARQRLVGGNASDVHDASGNFTFASGNSFHVRDCSRKCSRELIASIIDATLSISDHVDETMRTLQEFVNSYDTLKTHAQKIASPTSARASSARASSFVHQFIHSSTPQYGDGNLATYVTTTPPPSRVKTSMVVEVKVVK